MEAAPLVRRAACALTLLAFAFAAPAAHAVPHATSLDDRISGTARADVIKGRAGDDVLNGRAGNDRLEGQGGDDTLNGGPGRDRLAGGPGNDRLRGDAAADVLNGGAGRDVIRARDGVKDRVVCGPGRDTAILDALDQAFGCEVVRRPLGSPTATLTPAPAASAPVAGPTGPPPTSDDPPPPPPDDDPPPPPPDDDPPPPPPDTTPQLLAAGDIAGCTDEKDEETALLLDDLPGTVAPIGDVVYNSGTSEEFTNCYGPTWGRHLYRTRPAIGNHEYETEGAYPYFSYFGAAAGDPHEGWYSYDLGAWHIVVLNSNCAEIGGCDEESPQVAWLRQDLAEHESFCTGAYFHDPRFSSGKRHGSDLNMRTFWQVLYEHGAEFVMSGNDHHYERFGLQTPDGFADETDGIRQFVVGTGGRFLRPVQATPEPNSEAIDNTSHGILRVSLLDYSYEWEFVPIAGDTYTDSGIGFCH